MTSGFLLIDKPAGPTSHDVVAKIRRILATPKVKVGHTGTLDPAATGLMILVLGSYTKRAGEFSKLDKTYDVEATLGAVSATGDIQGPISRVSDRQPSEAEIRKTLKMFLGRQQQTPHPHSAIKVAGQRAYKLARAGQHVKIEPRTITIYGISRIKYAYPRLKFTVKVSSGTYIRSLVEDIGQKLATGAYLSALRRTKVGDFNITDAIPIENLEAKTIQTNLERL